MIFRRTDKYGYSRYYGGGGPALVIKIILAIVVVAALVVGAVVFAMQKYMVYTENGGHLEFPWDKKPSSSVVSDPLDADTTDDASNAADDSQDSSVLDNMVVDDQKADESTGDKSDGDQSTEDQTKPQTPAADPLTDGALIQHVSIGDVRAGYAKGTLTDKKANGIMLYLKESSGKLNYASELELAQSWNMAAASSSSDTVASVIDQLHEDGYYTLAYVNCFQDAAAGKSDYKLYTQSGGAWSDSDNVAWADPASQEMQDYIVGIVKDLAAMGYDEIVLKNACYPISGNTDNLSSDCYAPDTFADTMNSFYQKLAEAVKDSDTLLSVIVSSEVITEGADGSGQTLENLRQLGGRLWVDSGDASDTDALTQTLSEAGYPDNALALLVDKLDTDNSICQMNLD